MTVKELIEELQTFDSYLDHRQIVVRIDGEIKVDLQLEFGLDVIVITPK